MKSENPSTASSALGKALPSQFLVLPGPRQCLTIIRERFFLALFATLVVTIPVGYFIFSKPPEYRAAAALLVEPRTDRIVDMEHVVGTGLEGRGMEHQVLGTHMQQLRSWDFLRRVASGFEETERRQLIGPYLEEPNPNGAVSPDALAGLIRGNLQVNRLDGTLVLGIGVTHRSPEGAAEIANRVAVEYVRYLMDHSEKGNVSAIQFLRSQAAALREEVEELERQLHAYRTRENLVSLEENQNIIVDRLKQLNSSVTSARVARTEIDTMMEQVERYRDEGRDLLELDAIASFGSLPRLKQRREELEAEREVMSERYLRRHPAMIENARNLETVQQQIDRNIEEAINELRSRQENAHEREERLRSELAAAEMDSLKLDDLRVEYRAMERELETARNTHGRILRRLDEATITSQIENSNIRVFEEARTPGAPYSPDVVKAGLLLVFLGGVTFAGLPLGLYFADTRLKGWSDVETHLGRSVLGELPQTRGIKRAQACTVVARDLNDPATVESFRSLYDQVEIVSRVEIPKTLLVTSTLPGEGKTYVACNLAATYASHGRRTLLIDGDLRGPTIHNQFGLDNKKGLLRFLQESERCDGDPAGKETLGLAEPFRNLYVIPAGGRTKKATEMYDSHRAGVFFDWIRRYFDLILLDSPPLAVFPDALNLAHYARETLYVCGFNRVNRDMAHAQAERINQTDAKVLGIVMNRMPTRRSASIYYSGHGYRSRKAYKKYYSKV